MTEHLEYIVDENHTGERIDKYLSAVMPGQSRSYIQKTDQRCVRNLPI